VYVVRSRIGRGMAGEWVTLSELPRRPLTGLTRKVLRRLGCME
jgi:hypothetical protein